MARETLREAIEKHCLTRFGERLAFPDFDVKATEKGRQTSPWLRSDEENGYKVGPHAVDDRPLMTISMSAEPVSPTTPVTRSRKRAPAA